MEKVRLATVWLSGCSGCHMSFLDLDEVLIDIAGRIDLVYSPIADVKEYPQDVDVCLVEGAVANHDNLDLLRQVRANTTTVVSFGDCAVTGNIPAMRNCFPDAQPCLKRGFEELTGQGGAIPHLPGVLPELLDAVAPIHQYVKVDLYMPGCPPPADRIGAVVTALLEGKRPAMTGRDMLKFG